MNITEFSALLTAIVTSVYTAGTFLLWRTTKQTAQLVERQISFQVQASLSTAHHSVLDGHRDLYLQLIQNPELLKILARGFNQDTQRCQEAFLASIMINHVLRVFLDYKRNVALDNFSITSFNADAKDIFSVPFIRERWEAVKQFHPTTFRNHVDSCILNS